MPYKDKDRQREYQRERVAKIRADFLVGKSCVRCNSTDKLEIDHINRDTKTSHKVWSWSEERRIKELAKCQVLCKPCHKKKTVSELKQTHCKYGHKYDSLNKRGENRCSICSHNRTKKWRQKNKDNNVAGG